MLIRRAMIRDFGALRGPLSVDFRPGLNLIHGPNEIGKSTLMRAIWFAMTVRAKMGGQVREQVVPYGGGTPVVEVVFELPDGSELGLLKRFAKGQGVTEVEVVRAGGRERVSGEEAEARLRALLQITPPDRGRAKPEHLGLWPFVWVHHDEMSALPTDALHSTPRKRLRHTLEEIRGKMLSGAPGDALIEAVREAYSHFFTGRGTPTRRDAAPLVQAEREAERARADLAALLARRDELRGLASEYAEGLQRLQQLEAALPEDDESLAALVARTEAVQALRVDLDRAQATLDEARSRGKSTADLLEVRRGLRQALEEASVHLRTAVAARQEASAAVEAAALRTEPAEAEVRNQREARDRLRKHADVARRGLRRAESRHALGDARRRLERALEVRAKLDGLTAEPTLLQSEIDRLEALHAQRLGAQRLAQSKLVLSVLHGDAVSLTVDGRQAQLESGETSAFELGESGRLVIEERIAIEVQGDEAESTELDEALRALGFSSIEELRAQARAQWCRQQRIEDQRQHLSFLAPDGVDSLEASVVALRPEVDAPPTPLDAVVAQQSLNDLEASLTKAETSLRAAEIDLEQLRRQEIPLEVALRTTSADERAAQSTEAACMRALGQHEEDRGRDADLVLRQQEQAGQVQAEEARVERLRQRIRTLSDDLQIGGGGGSEAGTTGGSDDILALQRERDALRRALDVLTGRIAALKPAGLYDEIVDTEVNSVDAEQALQHWRQQSATVKLLSDQLATWHQRAKASLAEPLQHAIEPYLRILFPEANLTFDDDLGLSGIVRAGETEAFGLLSRGAREQLGLVVRLAVAQLLADDHGLPVVLDDPLVGTDSRRRERMMRLLKLASERLQLIVLTCHPDWYEPLHDDSTHWIDLEALVQGTQ